MTNASSKSSRAPSFFAVMIDAVAPLRGTVRMDLRRSPSSTGRDRVIVSCYAGAGTTQDQHAAAAVIVAKVLRNAGHSVAVDGSTIQAFAQ